MAIRIPIRATINLQGLRAGDRALIDPADPWMREALEREWIIADEPAAHERTLPADHGVDGEPEPSARSAPAD